MKLVMVGFLFFVLFSFVFAESSEITMNFNIVEPNAAQNQVPSLSFWDVYGDYVVGLLIVLIIFGTIAFSKKKKANRKVEHKIKKRAKGKAVRKVEHKPKHKKVVHKKTTKKKK